MRAARLHEYTDEMRDGLTIEAIDRPTITGANDVLIEVTGAGWCQTDNHIIEGMWEPYVEQPLPMTLATRTRGSSPRRARESRSSRRAIR